MKLALVALGVACASVLGWSIQSIVMHERGEEGLPLWVAKTLALVLCALVATLTTRRWRRNEALPEGSNLLVVVGATTLGLGVALTVMQPLDELVPGRSEYRYDGTTKVGIAEALAGVLVLLGTWLGFQLGVPRTDTGKQRSRGSKSRGSKRQRR